MHIASQSPNIIPNPNPSSSRVGKVEAIRVRWLRRYAYHLTLSYYALLCPHLLLFGPADPAPPLCLQILLPLCVDACRGAATPSLCCICRASITPSTCSPPRLRQGSSEGLTEAGPLV